MVSKIVIIYIVRSSCQNWARYFLFLFLREYGFFNLHSTPAFTICLVALPHSGRGIPYFVAWHHLHSFRTSSIGHLLQEESSFLTTTYIFWMFSFLLNNFLNFPRNVTEVYSLASTASTVYFKFYSTKLFLTLSMMIIQGHI